MPNAMVLCHPDGYVLSPQAHIPSSAYPVLMTPQSAVGYFSSPLLKADFEPQDDVERKFEDFNIINTQPGIMIPQTYHSTESKSVSSVVDQNILDHLSSHTVANFEENEVSSIALDTSSHSMFSSKGSTKPKHTVSILSNFFNKFQKSTTDQPLITSLNKTSNPNFFPVESNDSSSSWANIKVTESNTSREDSRNSTSTPTTEQTSKKNPQFSSSKFFLSNIFATTKGFSPSKILESKSSKSSNVNLDPCRVDFIKSYYINPDDKIVGSKNLNTKNILRHKDAGKNSDSHKSRTLSKDRTTLNGGEFSLKSKESSKTRGNSLYGDVLRKRSEKGGNTNVKEASKNRSSFRDKTAAAAAKTAASKESRKIRDQSSTKKLGQHSKLKPSNIPSHLISNLNSILLKGSNNSLAFSSSKLSAAASAASAATTSAVDKKLRTSSLSSRNSINNVDSHGMFSMLLFGFINFFN
ncbi:hypothetical protein HELRODRAFT_164687 [Helobdella robusta]|uniref:Uncharacterized protein n=1 Tax=Helobdella robusta TaxID=6412 RepID=T1EVQ2_HELRO|nr:hypothetical protein HELRODRAFT_164687 [Helobdella robusta]ESN92612.1 hypothetical protein HELRODRAFT_164687 [Helobdella robusta]